MKIKRITMLLGHDNDVKHLLYLMTEPEANHTNIIRGIGELVIR